MVSNTLELKSLKMKDGAAKKAANETVFDMLRRIKAMGIVLTKQQEQQLIEETLKKQIED